MDRRAFISGIMLAVFAPPLAAEGQEPGKRAHIGYLNVASTEQSEWFEAFRQGLRERGLAEGTDFTIEQLHTYGRFERLPELAADLVRDEVDVIVVAGEPAILAAKQATQTIPIVMAVSADPVGSGFARGLAHPGGNITGLSIEAVELAGKRLELMREVRPGTSRIAVLWNAAYPPKRREWEQTQAAGHRLGVTLLSFEVRTPGDFDRAFAEIGSARPDGLLAFSEPLTLAQQQRIADFAKRRRVPLVSEIRSFADAGGLLTYGPSLMDQFRRAAVYVNKILKGAKPSDLPIEQPTKFELVINLKTAKTLGVTIPQSLLVRADQVIQ
ncbi:MAG TPA: ABC transporter substrate-binding protein [Methylomirabilota bacterium]|nr:ABC transporter substrate-binding protein [Methylomirabilota bacterium]